MKIIVGLGNPGRKYQGTPHNLGFEVLELLAGLWGCEFRPSRSDQSDLLETRRGSETVLLAKPMTYMNLSGNAVREIMRNRPAEAEDLLVVSDDVNLPIGRLRLRARGSHGGHNGLRSIIQTALGEEFARLRIGAGPEGPVEDLTSFVLGGLRPEEREKLEEAKASAGEAVEMWIREGTEATANVYNGLRPEEEADG